MTTYAIQMLDGSWKQLAIGESEDLDETRTTLEFCVLYLKHDPETLRIVKKTFEVIG